MKRRGVVASKTTTKTKRKKDGRVTLLLLLLLVVALIFGRLFLQTWGDQDDVEYSLSRNVDTRSAINRTVWPSVTHTHWCRPPVKEGSPGLVYVKIPKTGSSTNVGINIQIARHVAARRRNNNNNNNRQRHGWWWPFHRSADVPVSCSYTYRHGRDHLLNRHDPSLLWSFVREPASRALSEYYHFEISRPGRLPTSISLQNFLHARRNYQFLYLVDHPDPQALLQGQSFSEEEEEVVEVVETMIHQFILQPYHFVGVLERTLESLAVMKLLWGLETPDLIVLSAKTSGGYDDGRSDEEGRCVRIQRPPQVLPTMIQDYMATQFHQGNVDYRLYDMVNKKLDDTIDHLGRNVVDQEVQRLETLQHVAEGACQKKAVFPCSANGTLQTDAATNDCYWTDSGCGYRCVQEAIQTYYSNNVVSV